MFPEFRAAGRWLQWGLRGLEQEMRIQVYADGVDYEASTSYHRLVTELFLSSVLLCHRNGIRVSPRLLSRLEKMLEYVMACTRPDGTVPLIGDADDGRLHKLVPPDGRQEFVDHRHLLGIGAMLFGREDFAQCAGDEWEDVFWLSDGEILPPPGRSKFRCASRAFQDSGMYVLRQRDLHMVIDAGPNGMNGRGGHGHNDTLSFTLYAYDRAFLVDPGSYVYTADYRWRNHFRSTAAHNVVVVDGQEMQQFGEQRLFELSEDARPRVLAWRTLADFDLFDAEHYGYERLPQPVCHRRQILLDKAHGLWVMRDLLSGAGYHTCALYFHFSHLNVEQCFCTDSLAVRTRLPGANLVLFPLATAGLSVRVFDDWVSLSYGHKVSAPVVCYEKQARVPVEFVTVMYPVPRGAEWDRDAVRSWAQTDVAILDEMTAPKSA